MLLNIGYLSYPVSDAFQLLFILLFLNVDYPPVVNYFMSGFRYAHYLFLPQIFSSGDMGVLDARMPEKFGIVVPDAGFLENTGHDFVVMFVVTGIFIVLKLIDLLTTYITTKPNPNKIHNS